MENYQSIVRDEMKQIEDQQHMEMMKYRMMVQHARIKSHEFNQQYNSVINGWRSAEEKSKKHESEFQFEAMLSKRPESTFKEFNSSLVMLFRKIMALALGLMN